MEISYLVKELRKEKKLTQKQLAVALGISATCYAGYEQGYREPNIEMIKKMSDFFGVSVDYLLGRSDDFGNINTNADLSSEESEIIETFRSLTSERDKTLFLLFVRNMQPASFAKKYKKPDETHRA